jgi:hypothetical protein
LRASAKRSRFSISSLSGGVAAMDGIAQHYTNLAFSIVDVYLDPSLEMK